MEKESGGVSFLGLLQIAFIVLKLTHVIDWSWWWVLSPALFACGTVTCILLWIAIECFLED